MECSPFFSPKLINDPNCTDADLKKALSTTELASVLHIDGCPHISPQGFIAVAQQIKKFVTIKITNCPGLNDEALNQISLALQALPPPVDEFIDARLTDLNLEGCTQLCQNAVNAMLRAFPELIRVNLLEIDATDETVNILSQLGENLEEINLSGRLITDKAIQKLLLACRPKIFVLRNCTHLTENTFQLIGKGTNRVKKIDILGCTEITTQGISQLAGQLAYCKTLIDSEGDSWDITHQET